MNILIVNVHSALNLGDDAIMQVTLKHIFQSFPTANVTIAANDPQSWKKYESEKIKVHPSFYTWISDFSQGTWQVNTWRMLFYFIFLCVIALLYRLIGFNLRPISHSKKSLIDAYCSADLLLSCGGGNFYAHHPRSPSLIWHLITLGFGMALGKKTILLPQSIGPIEGKFQRFLSRVIFNRVNLILLREGNSVSYLTDTLRVRSGKRILPDLAFGYEERTAFSINYSQDDSPLQIGLTLIDRGAQEKTFIHQSAYENAILDALAAIARNHPCQVNVMVQCAGPSSSQDDRLVSKKIYELLKERMPAALLGPFQTPAEIKSAIHNMDIMIGSRLHTGIFSICEARPFLLIGYQPKSNGTLKLLGLQDYCLAIEDLTSESIYQLFEKVLMDQSKISSMLSDQCGKARQQLEALDTDLMAIAK